MKTIKKRSSLKFSPVFGQKKGLRPPFLCSNLLPKLQRGGGGGMPQFCMLFHANYTILATQRGGPWPPLNTPLAEACNEFAGPTSASLRPGNTAPFEEMLQRWRAVGNTAFDFIGPRFEPQTSRSRDERVIARPTGPYSTPTTKNIRFFLKQRIVQTD